MRAWLSMHQVSVESSLICRRDHYNLETQVYKQTNFIFTHQLIRLFLNSTHKVVFYVTFFPFPAWGRIKADLFYVSCYKQRHLVSGKTLQSFAELTCNCHIFSLTLLRSIASQANFLYESTS